MSTWLKAGLIGGAGLIVLDLLGIIPCVWPIACVLGLFAYIAVGVLAAYWMPPRREAGSAAGQGAMAAALAALISGVVSTVITTVQMAVTDTSAVLSQLPAESLQQLQEAGVDPSLFMGPGFGAAIGSLCCVAGLILAAILGAVGGAVFAGLRPD
jgi:hypothetical protein